MELISLTSEKIDAKLWDNLVLESLEGQVYHLYDYIATLSNHDWAAIVVTDQNKYLAAFPYCISKKWGVKYFIQPPFCQVWGVIQCLDNNSNSKHFTQYKKCLNMILEALPPTLIYWNFKCSYRFNYPLPLHWKGYKLVPKYTYHLNLKDTKENILAGFASHTRREIKKAFKAGIQFEIESDASIAISLFKEEKPHLVHSKNAAFLERLLEVTKILPDSECFTISAYLDGQDIGSLIFFKYKSMLTFFFGTVRADFRNTGVMSAILWHGIENNLDSDVMDFDGSMIEEIEHFFRGFNTKPVMYLEASFSKYPLLLKFRS